MSLLNTATEALVDVNNAFRYLEFAIRLMCYCESGHLELKDFDADVSILFERENVGFPSGSFSDIEAVITPAQALVGMAFGASAMVLDAAFEVAGFKNNPNSRQPNDELRTLVYMVRCAFAHNPALPLWEVRGAQYARMISIKVSGTVIEIDLSSLHGLPFEYDHIGGFASWLRIRAASEVLIRQGYSK
ncbi:hypothetical protein [Methylomonas fluvii]|uniref:Uncharacterized protein n=1 Tax=Methylomonas fluvii TaxID=1854564 RepID=A0ABR9DA01_9GAMM|nr:hypothetical protein [Methylomonas fluvii]MBD9359049.1 hypothetical protein [Methylomonas fluvii]CAD6871721.1 hypothetical protein [Methylomonas fluvii]